MKIHPRLTLIALIQLYTAVQYTGVKVLGVEAFVLYEKHWRKTSSIQPINLYDAASSSLPGSPYFSGFQTSLNRDGSILAIASKLRTDIDNSGGLVQVFKWEEPLSKWIQLGSDILISTFGDWYGTNLVSFDDAGGTIAIGSRLVSNGKGRVQVLTLIDDVWSLKGNIIEGSQEGEHMGAALDISSLGNTVAIGSPFYNQTKDDQELKDIGRVTIWDYDANTELWSKSADIYGESAADEFGSSVAISGPADFLTVGAPSNDGDINRMNAGHVRVFEPDVGTGGWRQIGSDIDGEQFLDYSGYSLAIGQNSDEIGKYRIAIGAYMNDGEEPFSNNQLDNRGHVRLYDYNNDVSSNWEQAGLDIDGEMMNDFSGASIAIDGLGDRVIIGATGNDRRGTNAGHARAYEFSSQKEWLLIGDALDGEIYGDEFGYSVQMNAAGDRIIVGAPRFGFDDDGKVYIYDLIDAAPTASPAESSASHQTCFVYSFEWKLALFTIMVVIF